MKKPWLMLIAFGIGLWVSNQTPILTHGLTQQSAPYLTYTIGPNGRYVQTQTAYEPAGFFDMNLTLRQPEDMMRWGNDLYVADTGNQRIVKFNMDTGEGTVVIDGLSQPTGIHLTETGELYVADKGARVINYYGVDRQLIRTYGRPTEPIFGEDTPFVPLKVTSGPRGILYVVGEGATSGLIQLNFAGEFIGFFGTNSTNFSWLQWVSNFFGITRATNIPNSPLNVALDAKGSVFTVSPLSANQIQKFNIASQTILSMSNRTQPVSLHLNDFDNLFTISNEGMISEYDSYGNLIFEFGGLDRGQGISGLYVNPVDILTDDQSNIWVLDKGAGKIQLLQRSEFTSLVHQGLINFKEGIYSLEQWENVLRMNSMFALANAALARGHYRLQAYEDALTYYAIAFDRNGFSEAFWQLRYQWLELNLGTVFIIGIFALLLLQVLRVGKQRILLTAWGQRLSNHANVKKLNQDLRLTQHVLFHPLDTYQDIKHLKRSSSIMALALYMLTFVASLFEIYATGFIFQTVNLNNFSVVLHLLTFATGIGIFVFANYLVATITNGEGFLKDVWIATAHALIPYLIITPILTVLSNGLTYNEWIVYQILDGLRFGWTAILIILMIKEIHNYDVKGLVKNLLLTIFTMVMIILIGFLLYVLFAQLFAYIEGIISEVILRA